MWRSNLKATSGLAALLVAGLTGCVDLTVPNPNAPSAAQVKTTAGDVEALIAGTYTRWLYTQSYDGPTMMMSNAAGQHAAPWANAGMEYYARIPRNPTVNSPGDANILNLVNAWTQSYRVLAAVHDGLQLIDSGKVDLGANTLRVRAYARYMQGLAHGTIALLYDSAFVYDEKMDPKTPQPFKPYPQVMAAALGYLGEAATLAASGSFTLPSSWMSQSVSSSTLEKLAHTYAAIFRAAVARTPAERKAVNWTQVAADANAGITADWQRTSECSTGAFCAGGDIGMYYIMQDGWTMQNNWVLGMADQSGRYQSWVTAALSSKQPFLISTPDKRWPQGATESAQRAAPGDYFITQANDQGTWARPDRGTWRWSYYGQPKEPFYSVYWVDQTGSAPEVTVEELSALKAEAAYYANDFATVAAFINATRTDHGLAATNAAGLNTDCVPKMPPTHPTNPSGCGDLWEMFKWEKRLETEFLGPLAIGFYFDSRGWGDLMEGTILQFPVPYREMQILQRSPYNYGGVGGSYGAPKGSYGY